MPNLNVALHGGLTAPASSIVGINDTQTLTAKTLTSPVITQPTLDGYSLGAAHVQSLNSAGTNFGVALGTQTLVANLPSNTVVSVNWGVIQSLAGVGCCVTNNSVSGVVNWTAPGSTAESQATGNMSLNISGNGAVDSGAAFSQTQMVMGFVAKAGTSVTYATSSTLGSTGCTTTPQYTVYARHGSRVRIHAKNLWPVQGDNRLDGI